MAPAMGPTRSTAGGAAFPPGALPRGAEPAGLGDVEKAQARVLRDQLEDILIVEGRKLRPLGNQVVKDNLLPVE